MKEKDLIFFQPLWRRIAVTVFCFLWGCYEWITGAPFWGIIAFGLTGYCYWTLFYNFESIPADEEGEE